MKSYPVFILLGGTVELNPKIASNSFSPQKYSFKSASIGFVIQLAETCDSYTRSNVWYQRSFGYVIVPSDAHKMFSLSNIWLK